VAPPSLFFCLHCSPHLLAERPSPPSCSHTLPRCTHSETSPSTTWSFRHYLYSFPPLPDTLYTSYVYPDPYNCPRILTCLLMSVTVSVLSKLGRYRILSIHREVTPYDLLALVLWSCTMSCTPPPTKWMHAPGFSDLRLLRLSFPPPLRLLMFQHPFSL